MILRRDIITCVVVWVCVVNRLEMRGLPGRSRSMKTLALRCCSMHSKATMSASLPMDRQAPAKATQWWVALKPDSRALFHRYRALCHRCRYYITGAGHYSTGVGHYTTGLRHYATGTGHYFTGLRALYHMYRALYQRQIPQVQGIIPQVCYCTAIRLFLPGFLPGRKDYWKIFSSFSLQVLQLSEDDQGHVLFL